MPTTAPVVGSTEKNSCIIADVEIVKYETIPVIVKANAIQLNTLIIKDLKPASYVADFILIMLGLVKFFIIILLFSQRVLINNKYSICYNKIQELKTLNNFLLQFFLP